MRIAASERALLVLLYELLDPILGKILDFRLLFGRELIVRFREIERVSFLLVAENLSHLSAQRVSVARREERKGLTSRARFLN